MEKRIIELLNGDCMDVMVKYPDKHFDLAIVDPPYGISIANRNGSIGQKKGQGKITRYSRKNWDENIPDKYYWEELFRVSKNQIIWGANYFTEYLPPSKGWIVWDKRQPEGVSFAMAELAYTSFDKSVKMFSCSRALIGNKVSNNPKIAKQYAKIHPTQKPVELYRWLLKKYANEGDLILDTHLGSGSIALACHYEKFDLIGCEIDKEYYNAACNRLHNARKQQIIEFN